MAARDGWTQPHPQTKPSAVVGLFFGAIEEGARIFTPTRLLPFGHPEAGTHDFPTVLQLHGPEFPMLIWLGEQSGLHLWATLERYPTMPDSAWPYGDHRPPPGEDALRSAAVSHMQRRTAPLAGLRAALFDGTELVAFIVDTRGFTLAERGLTRSTASGLDLTRAEFLARVSRAPPHDARPGSLIALFWDR
jgi:hypothetical protein